MNKLRRQSCFVRHWILLHKKTLAFTLQWSEARFWWWWYLFRFFIRMIYRWIHVISFVCLASWPDSCPSTMAKPLMLVIIFIALHRFVLAILRMIYTFWGFRAQLHVHVLFLSLMVIMHVFYIFVFSLQHSCECMTWKSATEIKSLLLQLLLI